MNKTHLLQLIIDRLQFDLDIARRAAQTAYEAATHEENIAENKYDTLGLEASYLAAGQARRVEEIRQCVALYRQASVKPFDAARGIQVGDLVTLQGAGGERRYLFLGPDAAGLNIQADECLVTVITARAPLGQSLMGKQEGDDVEIVVKGQRQVFDVTQVL
ncbi:GreA/GreB family elongation factor [Pseudomonas syringae]|nr:GreA/GreB family elongation factor [Pseudomonas syringae]MBD8574598.1 GreA/GreB family elongation factor [Pseudomonas syringae]MBD8789160.1 GreA/GreB family elongation factor [Pseudomonas syringae]MBD8800396.1 GreA/GreB family elongation factor [Pseudomonas syringae]MBD8810588.1 GreA/GreB family elongation factor [Pseudomonas syringae]